MWCESDGDFAPTCVFSIFWGKYVKLSFLFTFLFVNKEWADIQVIFCGFTLTLTVEHKQYSSSLWNLTYGDDSVTTRPRPSGHMVLMGVTDD